MTAIFADIVGHASVLEMLVNELEHPSHAYLFTGPSSVGKAAVARRFAAGLLGGSEVVLKRSLAGNHPDLVLVEPEGRSSITVDQARGAVATAALAPLEAMRKVFLLEEGGAMNDEAANALLKTIEEPTASTIFIIVAESEDDLPATVASRSRTVVFGRVSHDELVGALEQRGIEPDQAERAARISGGRPGLALGLATRPEVAEFRHAWLGVPLMLPQNPGQAFLLADQLLVAADPLLEALKARQADEAKRQEATGTVDRGMRDRHDRELKRATAALYATGLEILASFYRDVAAAQFGSQVRNPDVLATDLTRVRPATALQNADRVLETIESLDSNQRPVLALASLLSDLGAAG